MTSADEPLTTAPTIVGQNGFQYRVHVGWEQLPAGWTFVEVAGVATDAAGNVFVFNRGEHPMIVFDRAGRFLRSWGEGVFVRPHGLTIGPDDAVYCVDDSGHTVRKFTPEGQLLLTLGTPGQRSDTGATTIDYRTILRAGGPFNLPTNLALSPSGEMFVADGYGNARVHRFSPEGELISSWGEPGAGPGQFHVPHGIAVDAHGTVFVADRENDRLQFFTPEGTFLGQWTDIARPCQVFFDVAGNVFVAELGYRAGMFPGTEPPPGNPTGGRMSVFNAAGELQARWGGGDQPCQPGDFFAPHDVWVDRFGDLYVGEVTWSAGANRGVVPPDCHSLQKFVRIPLEESR
jgi:DNA-binding beta-propeller fold protein YncE